MVGIPSGYIGAGIAEADGWTYFGTMSANQWEGTPIPNLLGGTPAATVPPTNLCLL